MAILVIQDYQGSLSKLVESKYPYLSSGWCEELCLQLEQQKELLEQAKYVIERIGTTACGCEDSGVFEKVKAWLMRME